MVYGETMFLYIALFLSLLLGSCSGSKSINKTEVKEKLSFSIDNEGKIKLLPHQILPIDYLKKNPDQKGLLVNHYMGTGKTFLGIGFAETFPDYPVIILAPKFIESHWMNQLDEYGVKDKSRYSFVSYEDAPKSLINDDLTKSILLIDEVHNIVKKMRSVDVESNNMYTKVYMNLRSAYKILGLSGTPIYGDESDIAFLLNLVSGQDLMPFNQEEFRIKYTSILSTKQFFRGYLSESNLMVYMLPTSLALFGGALLGFWGLGAGVFLGVGLTVGTNLLFDPQVHKLRALDAEKMAPAFSKYMSYFKFDENHFKDFPAQDFKVQEVPYNKYQYSFFMHLVEGDLPVDQLQRLLANENVKKSDDYVKINSTNIHQQIYSVPGSGRDIGNFDFTDANGALVEAPKFVKIYDEIQKNKSQTVIYSNYYETGILAFEKFLQRQKFDGKYGIIHPKLNVQEVSKLVEDYNKEKISLLMLHPDVTEGISLKGTQYMHILEPMLNSTVLEQVIGRTRRFQSHNHLPKEKQKVVVRMWQSTSSNWDPNIGGINRVNWFKRYRELAYMSRWGIGISQVDKNYAKKALNPEELSFMKLKTLETNFAEIQRILNVSSIENKYEKVAN